MPDGKVNQVPAASAEGTAPSYRQNRRAELVVPDWRFQMTQEGRTFNISNAARQTALATGGTSFSDTAPAFIMDVAAGTTMIPLEVVLNQGGTVAGGVITVIAAYDNKLRYSSGGTAITVRPNYVTSGTDQVSSAVTAYGTSPTAAAVGREMSLFGLILVQGVTNTVSSILPTNVNFQAATPVFIEGPGSLVIYTFAAVTQPSWFFRFAWAEYPTSMVR